MGYNAYSILKTGRDEWGNKLPLYFGSFGEFRLPVYFYLTVVSVFLFGLTEFSVRFWAAVFGLLVIASSFFLTHRVLKKSFSQKKSLLTALVAALFLAFEPIHLHFSRMGIEVLPCLFFALLGFLILKINKKNFLLNNFLAFSSFLLSIFSYHAARLFLPLFLISGLLLDFKKKKAKYNLVLAGVLLVLTFSLGTKGIVRLKGISLFHPQSGVVPILIEKINEHKDFKTPFLIVKAIHNKAIDYSLLFLRNYFKHFTADFLFFIGDTHDKRFSLPFLGNFLLFELPFFILGLFYLAKKRNWFFILWLVLAPIASALAFQSPSISRSIFLMPSIQVISASGLLCSFALFKKGALKKLYFIMIVFILGFNIVLVLDSYFIHQLIHRPYYWNYGFKKAALEVKEMELNYDKIIVGKEGSPYIHFLFFQKTNPNKIWEKIERFPQDKFGFKPVEKMGKYYFDSSCPIKESKEKILYVCEKEVDENNFVVIDRIDYKDGALNFVLFEKKDEK